MKPNKPNTNQNNRNRATTVKWTLKEINQIQLRAKALGITKSEYINRKKLESIDKLQKASEQETTAQKKLVMSSEILDKLSQQGIRLDKIAREIDSKNLKGESIEQCVAEIAEIRSSSEQLLNSITNLKKSL